GRRHRGRRHRRGRRWRRRRDRDGRRIVPFGRGGERETEHDPAGGDERDDEGDQQRRESGHLRGAKSPAEVYIAARGASQPSCIVSQPRGTPPWTRRTWHTSSTT